MKKDDYRIDGVALSHTAWCEDTKIRPIINDKTIALLGIGVNALDVISRTVTSTRSYYLSKRLLQDEENGVFPTGVAKGIIQESAKSNKY